MTALTDVADLVYGCPFASSDFREGREANGLPVVRIRDVVPGVSNTTYIGKYDPAYFVDDGDILVGMDGEFNLARWRGGRALLNQRVCKVVPRPGKVEARYLFWALPRHLKTIEDRTPFATVKHLSAKALASIHLTLPRLEEQRRIADVLDKADAIRRKRKEAIALTEEILRSAFFEMFGDPVTNPKGWPVRSMDSVLAGFVAGWSANGDARTRLDDEYGVLKISSVTSGWFRPDEHKAVAASEVQRELVTPRRGDLLFSRANTRELVAACCLVERDEPRLFLPDKLWRLRPQPQLANTTFLRFLLADPRFRSELTKRATGTSGSMLNISMEKLRAVDAPLPPLRSQAVFERFVWRTFEVRARHRVAHEESEQLFDALAQGAFAGELTDSRTSFNSTTTRAEAETCTT